MADDDKKWQKYRFEEVYCFMANELEYFSDELESANWMGVMAFLCVRFIPTVAFLNIFYIRDFEKFFHMIGLIIHQVEQLAGHMIC